MHFQLVSLSEAQISGISMSLLYVTDFYLLFPWIRSDLICIAVIIKFVCRQFRIVLYRDVNAFSFGSVDYEAYVV